MCQAGTVVTIPQLQLDCSTSSSSGNAQTVMAVLIGGLSPHLEFANKPSSHSCGDVFFQALISVVSILAAPELAVFLGGLAGAAINSAVGIGTIAGAMDASMQELAKGVGTLKHFSWSNVIDAGLSAGFMNSSLGKSLSADMQGAKTLTEARDAISNLALYYGALNISEQMALIAINQQTHLDIKQILASMSQTMMDNWIGFASGGPIPGIADKSITTNQLAERLSLDLTESLIGSAIMGVSFDLQTFFANEAGSYVGGKLGNKLISHYTQSSSKPPARSASQITEDSLAPNDRHYLTATAAGQGKGQSPDFLAVYAGMNEGDDLLNMMMGIENTSNHPVVQTNSKAKATNQKLSVKKAQATAQGARVNYSDPFSELPQGMAEMVDSFYSATNNQAVHFRGNSLNPESHYYPQAASAQSSKVATTPGEALSKLAHMDLSDWGRPMASMEGHPGWGESLIAGAHWEYSHVVTDIDHINNGNFRQRIGGTISLGLDVVTALSMINPMAEGAVMAARAGYGVAREAVPLVGRALEAVGIFGRGSTKVISTPYGRAVQSETNTAITARSFVEQGSRIYRGGKLGYSAGPEGQFWSLENPLNSGYAKKYGLPIKNAQFDFVEVAVMKPGSRFITREAPGMGTNGGGGIEVVVHPGEPKLQYFHMRWEPENDSIQQRIIPRA